MVVGTSFDHSLFALAYPRVALKRPSAPWSYERGSSLYKLIILIFEKSSRKNYLV